MNNGFSFQDALAIAATKKNQAVIKVIQKELADGEKAETVLITYLPAQCVGYFRGFIQYMPLKDSMNAVLQILSSERIQKEELLKGMGNPTLLFFGVNAGVLIFNTYVMPVMIDMMSSFQYQDSSTTVMLRGMTMVSSCIWVLMPIVLTALIVCLQPKKIIHTYRYISKCFPDGMMVKYASSDFCRFYLECVKRKIATKESLYIMKHMEGKPLVREIAENLDHSLEEGMEIQTAIAHSTAETALVRIFRIAVYASNCEDMMTGYLEMVRQRTIHEIHLYSRILQCISYSSVGLVILLVYQVLLMPIQMMQTL